MKITAAEYRQKYATQSEDDLQAACVAWFRTSYPKFRKRLTASLNGAPLLNGARTWKRLQRLGANEGEADLFLAVPSGDCGGLYIEMKTKTGRQRETQKEFEADVTEHYGYAICRTLEEFQNTVRRYLSTGEY